MRKSVSCILLVCLLGLMAYAEETQEQQVQRLIGELQDEDFNVRSNAVRALRKIRRRCGARSDTSLAGQGSGVDGSLKD